MSASECIQRYRWAYGARLLLFVALYVLLIVFAVAKAWLLIILGFAVICLVSLATGLDMFRQLRGFAETAVAESARSPLRLSIAALVASLVLDVIGFGFATVIFLGFGLELGPFSALALDILAYVEKTPNVSVWGTGLGVAHYTLALFAFAKVARSQDSNAVRLEAHKLGMMWLVFGGAFAVASLLPNSPLRSLLGLAGIGALVCSIRYLSLLASLANELPDTEDAELPVAVVVDN